MTSPGTSRIIVKNIGKNMTENSLRDIFNQKGEVTDVRIQKTKSGKSREFAFIGYRTEQQAIDAQRYFNNTFLQTSRVTVDLAKSIHDPLLLLSSKSRYTKNKLIKQNHLLKKEEEEEEERKKQREQQKQQQRQQTKQGGGGGTESQERAKAEFLSVMKSRSQSNVWGNDDVHIHLAQERQQQQQQQATEAQDSDNDSDNDSESDNNSSDYNEPKPINKATTKTKAKKDFHDLESDSDSAEESDSEDGIVKGKSNSSSVKASSDLDFLRGKVKKNITEDSESDSDQDDEKDSSDSSEEASEVEEEEDNQPKTKKNKVVTVELESEEMNVSSPPQDAGVENEEDEGRLFIRNLPYSVSEEELTELFSRYGPLSQVHLPLNEDKRGKGYGFVQFMIPEHSKSALTSLDGSSFQGRLLHIIPAKAQQTHSVEEQNHRTSHLSSFQKKKEDERRKMANKREGWNASYVRSDTVIDSLSDKYGISRGDILDTDGVGGGELAVRLAIGETQVIQENKEYFSSHGVDFDSLESALSSSKSKSTKPTERSTTTLLIKNLPHDVVGEELEEMFANFGSIASFLLPPSKTVALIDFIEPTEARKAFSSLAYRRYHHVPLYLEWAPLNTIKQKTTPTPPTASAVSSVSLQNPIKQKQTKKPEAAAAVGTEDSADYSTLYLKNLNFQTTESDLRSHLTHRLGINDSDIRTISIPKKQTKSGQPISMGYGFIEFKTIQGAVKMLSRINGSRLDEHVLEVKPSDKRLSIPQQSLVTTTKGGKSHTSKGKEGESNSNPNETNKLIVRNVAFQATKEELKTLFSAFGTIKTLRIPRKIGGVHRGFAFIDFNTKQEATRAMQALSRTHMYGRHLVIEYANNEEEMDDKEKLTQLRERADQNIKSVIKTAQSQKRKVGEILDSQNEADMMMA